MLVGELMWIFKQLHSWYLFKESIVTSNIPINVSSCRAGITGFLEKTEMENNFHFRLCFFKFVHSQLNMKAIKRKNAVYLQKILSVMNIGVLPRGFTHIIYVESISLFPERLFLLRRTHVKVRAAGLTCLRRVATVLQTSI